MCAVAVQGTRLLLVVCECVCVCVWGGGGQHTDSTAVSLRIDSRLQCHVTSRVGVMAACAVLFPCSRSGGLDTYEQHSLHLDEAAGWRRCAGGWCLDKFQWYTALLSLNSAERVARVKRCLCRFTCACLARLGQWCCMIRLEKEPADAVCGMRHEVVQWRALHNSATAHGWASSAAQTLLSYQ
jgi:hypothetical protein